MLITFLFILIFQVCFSAPRHLEVWFLSNSKKAQLLKLINDKDYKFSPLTAALECQEMGDYCFDPQFGLYKPGDEGNLVITDQFEKDQSSSMPHATSVDRNLITCDPTNRFDIFCGKSRSTSGEKSKLDLWIDTSSSMREFDYSDKDGGCFRKSLVTNLDKVCAFNEKVNVMMFDTSIKQAGTFESLCNNQGLNDYKKLMDWIERSTANSLIIITDIYELHKEFADFVENKHGKIRGDKDQLSAQELNSLIDELAKLCK